MDGTKSGAVRAAGSAPTFFYGLFSQIVLLLTADLAPTPMTIDVSGQPHGAPINVLVSPTGRAFRPATNTICEKNLKE